MTAVNCDQFDVIVVGAGVEGSATALNLAVSSKNHERILLLEQVCSLVSIATQLCTHVLCIVMIIVRASELDRS